MKEYQIMALDRAEEVGILSVDIDSPDEDIISELKKMVLGGPPDLTNIFLALHEKAIEAGYKRYIMRAIKREIRKGLREIAEEHAIKVFATNLKNLLMTAPLKNRPIIGIDPGFRTGCKVAVIDAFGKFLDHGVIYPHPPQKKASEAEKNPF